MIILRKLFVRKVSELYLVVYLNENIVEHVGDEIMYESLRKKKKSFGLKCVAINLIKSKISILRLNYY